MKPDANQHDPDPERLRELIEKSGLSIRAAAQQIGISDRMLRYYLTPEDKKSHRPCPYPEQFALEALAAAATSGEAATQAHGCAPQGVAQRHNQREV
ncbi:hypothetical protein V6U78_12440 [Marinospirillum sp. MEB164]|uniref:Uncharacterized protein n=1 Tax=Marinospirillum alkalitolerans TaxID=3123374 RepID=A0ABW8Q133_9GAMM